MQNADKALVTVKSSVKATSSSIEMPQAQIYPHEAENADDGKVGSIV